MMSVLRVIVLMTVFLAIAGIQARNFPADYTDDVQTIDGKTSFPDASRAASNAANGQITGIVFFSLTPEILINWFTAIIYCIPSGLYTDNYIKSANLGRPPRPSPPQPRPPPGPHPVPYIEMPVSRRSPQNYI